jgi:hypothetical protein
MKDHPATLSTVQPGFHLSNIAGDLLDGTTSGRYLSFVLKIDEGALDSHFNGRIVMADGRRVELATGAYLVRVWIEDQTGGVRGVIRNEETKEKVRFQSGDRLAAFIQNSLKNSGDAPDTASLAQAKE